MTSRKDSDSGGVMTGVFMDALRADPNQSYLDLLRRVRDGLQMLGCKQIAQFSSSHRMGTFSTLAPEHLDSLCRPSPISCRSAYCSDRTEQAHWTCGTMSFLPTASWRQNPSY